MPGGQGLLRITRTAILLGMTAALALAGAACGASAQTTEVDTTAERGGTGQNVAVTMEAVPWRISSVPGPRTIAVIGEVGHCVGDPRPRLRGAQIRYRNDAAYVRLNAAIPKKKMSTKNELCAGVELFLRTRITLRRDVEDLRIYDGSTKPPELRWPR